MFSLAQPAYYPSYNPYEQLLLQQELQRRRQIEAYLRQQREAEELERRRAYERALLQAEYERRCAAEYERRRRSEVERLRRQSVFDGGMQDLFDAIYGRARSVSPQREDVHAEQNVTVNDKAAPPPPPPPSAPTPPPTSEPVSSEPENEQTEDATPQVETAPSLAAVQSILASFASLRSGFTFPEHLDFLPSSSRLAYTPNNAPLHGYEHTLTGLLTQLDAVESFGDDKVRKARKEAVKTIELELEKLDQSKAEAWKKQTEPEPVAQVPEVTSLVSSEPEPMEVDPVTVPLPQNSDEDLSEAVVDSGGHAAAQGLISAESSVPAPEVLSTVVQLPIVEDLPPLPSSPELLSRSLSSPSPSDSSDAESDMELEEYIDVQNATLVSETDLETKAEEVATEKDEGLELMRDWDFDL